jgi:hypothetical protein
MAAKFSSAYTFTTAININSDSLILEAGLTMSSSFSVLVSSPLLQAGLP